MDFPLLGRYKCTGLGCSDPSGIPLILFSYYFMIIIIIIIIIWDNELKESGISLSGKIVDYMMWFFIKYVQLFKLIFIPILIKGASVGGY